MKFHQIRNATQLIEYQNKHFLIDPMFAPKDEYSTISDKPWPVYDLPISPKDIVKNIDAVILTHLHTDHFDKYAQDVLPKSIKIFVQDQFDKNALEKEHFNNIEILSSEGTDFEGIKLFKTECLHGVRAMAEPIFLANGMRWESMGVVFQSGNEPTFYLVGDTLWFEGVKNALDKYNPKYAVVNASAAEIGNSGQILMGTDDIKELHSYSPETNIIASHLDNIGNATQSRAELKASEVNKYIYIPVDGEIMYIN